MVEDVDVAPGMVGLLFAGSSSVAIANPIDAVLSAFPGVMIVGASSTSLSHKILHWAKISSGSAKAMPRVRNCRRSQSRGSRCSTEDKEKTRSETVIDSSCRGCGNWPFGENSGPEGDRGLC